MTLKVGDIVIEKTHPKYEIIGFTKSKDPILKDTVTGEECLMHKNKVERYTPTAACLLFSRNINTKAISLQNLYSTEEKAIEVGLELEDQFSDYVFYTQWYSVME